MEVGRCEGVAEQARLQWVIQAHEKLMLKRRGGDQEYQEATAAADQYSPVQVYYDLPKVVVVVVVVVAKQESHGESYCYWFL